LKATGLVTGVGAIGRDGEHVGVDDEHL
jgi:hypothetical protein